MSRPERREELRREFELSLEERDLEQTRKAALSLYDRIEEVTSIEDVKDILHRLASGERE